MPIDAYFEDFKTIFPEIEAYSPKQNCDSFAIDEFKRFHSIAGTMLENFKHVSTSLDERRITHILLRSLLENYFQLLYIYDDVNPAEQEKRFNDYLNGFKIDYKTLYNEPRIQDLLQKSELEQTPSSWTGLPKPMDLKSILAQVRNANGERLDWLYFTYRITSFDTHGRSLSSVFKAAFGKDCNFPYLKIGDSINLIANEYLSIFDKIKNTP